MIRTCLFDLGNVLVFFSHARMCEQLGRVCGKTADDIRRLLIESGVQWDYERGRITPQQFHDWFQSATGASVPFDQLHEAGSDIFWLNEPVLVVLDRLKKLGQRLVLISNTCQTHFDWVWNRFDVLQRFDGLVTSYRAGSVKPEPGIFQAALAEIGCPPHECFYTDDIAEFVVAGGEHGLQAELFTDVPTLITELRRREVHVDAC